MFNSNLPNSDVLKPRLILRAQFNSSIWIALGAACRRIFGRLLLCVMTVEERCAHRFARNWFSRLCSKPAPFWAHFIEKILSITVIDFKDASNLINLLGEICNYAESTWRRCGSAANDFTALFWNIVVSGQQSFIVGGLLHKTIVVQQSSTQQHTYNYCSWRARNRSFCATKTIKFGPKQSTSRKSVPFRAEL